MAAIRSGKKNIQCRVGCLWKTKEVEWQTQAKQDRIG